MTIDNQALYRRAKQLIPGGTQLLSKRPELYAPDVWPAYFREARGYEVVDVDGRRFLDMTHNGIGSCLLGYANEAVNRAVTERIRRGSMCTLNSPEEVELAELMIELHPWAASARYSRTGGESMAIAIRIARAATDRDRVVFCGYHGWSDWYLAANLPGENLSEHLLPGLNPKGVPKTLAGTALTFSYNDLESLQQIMAQHGSDIAAIVMEPIRSEQPAPGFLEDVRELANLHEAKLIFDEISIGWRIHLGGAHLKFGVEPDIAVFAKALSNGFPMGAIIGKQDVMDAAQDSFISSTYWTEGVGPTAAIATIRQMKEIDVPKHVERIGSLMQQHWVELGRKHVVPAVSGGLPAMAHLEFDHPQNLALDTLFSVRMLERNILAANRFYPTLAHDEKHVDTFTESANEVFKELAQAIRANDISERLQSPVRMTGFRRLAN